MPSEFWARVAPSEWSRREVDYDGLDADGCEIVVMINEKDFRYWVALLYPEVPPQNTQRKTQARGKKPLILGYLKEMFPVEKYPSGVPEAAYCPRKKLKAELIEKDKRLASLHDDTLREAINQYNASVGSILNSPK